MARRARDWVHQTRRTESVSPANSMSPTSCSDTTGTGCSEGDCNWKSREYVCVHHTSMLPPWVPQYNRDR